MWYSILRYAAAGNAACVYVISCACERLYIWICGKCNVMPRKVPAQRNRACVWVEIGKQHVASGKRHVACASANPVLRRNVEWVCGAQSCFASSNAGEMYVLRWRYVYMFNSEATIRVGIVVASFSTLPRNNCLEQIVVGSFDLLNWFVVCHFIFYAMPLFFGSVLFSAFILAAPFHLMAFK